MTITTGNTEPGVTVSPLVDERMRSNEPEISVDLESPDIPIAYAYAVPETAEKSTPANPAAANSSATSPAHSFTPATNLGRRPCIISCPFCLKRQETLVFHRWDAFTIFFVVTMFFLSLWPLIFLPLCVRTLVSTTQRCGNCKRVVGRTRSLQEMCG